MIRTAIAAALMLAAPTLAIAPAQAEVIETSETHFVTRHTVDIATDSKALWLKLIVPGEWWNDAHTWSADAKNMTLTPQAGGCFCERIPAKDGVRTFGLEGSVQHMVVVQSVPYNVLRMRGGLGPLQSEPVDGVLTITMQDMKDKAGKIVGTRTVWEYVVGGTMRFEIDTISKAVDGVIGQQALGLAKVSGGLIEKPVEASKESPKEAAKEAPKEATKKAAKVASEEATKEPAKAAAAKAPQEDASKDKPSAFDDAFGTPLKEEAKAPDKKSGKKPDEAR